MSGLMGGGKSKSTDAPRISGLQIQQSGYGAVIPLVYGTNRVSPTLIYYGDWTAIPHTSTTEAGGKGGGTSLSNTNYTYSATIAFCVAEGPIAGVSTVWRNNQLFTDQAQHGLTLFQGSYPQSPWGFLVTAHPDEAIGYPGVAYACASNYNLGTGSLGNHLFEVQGFFVAPGNPDVLPNSVVADFLTGVGYGAGFPSANLGDFTPTRDYCVANEIYISPAIDQQRPAHEWITEWMQIANSEVFWSEGKLKMAPYDATPVIRYDLTDDDFIVTGDEDPVRVTRKRPADAFNHVVVEFLNRRNQYTAEPAEAKDQASIERYGLRTKPTVTLHAICRADVARLVAQTLLQRELYIRNTYEFNLSWKYARLEPMDLVSITDTVLGLYQFPVRILNVEENDDGLLTFTAEEYNAVYSNAVPYALQQASGYQPNYATVPAAHSTATIFLAPAAVGDELWMGVMNTDPAYGGSQIWMSYDDYTYFQIGKIIGNSTMGTTTSTLVASGDPDTTHALGVDVSASGKKIFGVNQTAVDAFDTLCLAGNEFLAFRDATLTGVGRYGLAYLRRGLYGSTAGSVENSRFVKCDQGIFRYPYNPLLKGSTVYFKFVAFNAVGAGVQDIATISSVSFYIPG